ncbi:MAG TPA: malto-oligosyltrehalose synthase [Acidimicrobiales bacterium]|nr:malto-oligosyltrehalose synthase [Acidimicrobiales bacterium]
MIPRSTYRVQLHAGFTFDDAAGIVPYLADLGVSHLYCSPYLQAAPGSTHGYDVVDHHALNADLGGATAHARLGEALASRGMSQVLDIVPNHMAIAGRENAWWWDVLENGPSSRYASYFDIDWDPPERRLTTKVLVPVLGDHYGRVLEAGELQLVREGGGFTVRYFDHEVPVSPRTLDDILARAAERSGDDGLASLATAFGRLPHALSTDRASVIERHRDKEVLRGRLEELLASPALAVAVDEEVKAVNEDPDALDALLQRQNYRLAFWRTAGRELDYRRFFDITSLVALRAEDGEVFADTHELVLDLVANGAVSGLRVDHVDGLRDPLGYVDRLRRAAGPETYVVVEKILEGDERLPPAWPVDGTSGYDFLVHAGAALIDGAAEAALTATYERFTGEAARFEEIATAAKHEVMRTVLAADVERLTELFVLVAEGDRRHRDYTRSQLRDALRETIAAFEVYRTYVRPDVPPDPLDESRVARATAAAAERRPDLEPELFRFLRDLLLLRHHPTGDATGVAAELAVRFQQVSSPVMAKAVEDTAFYRYNRFVALNEVGGDPSSFGTTPEAFHARFTADPATGSMLASSTHDTKRSEDVRARLAYLSEIPAAWEDAVWRWAHLNERHRSDGWPDRNAEYLLYQVVVGAWPLPVDRAVAYMEKASKEAKVHTSWVDPAPAYDEALSSFTSAVLSDASFVADLEAFLSEHRVVAAGWWNSLVQTALKLTCPGVPDTYQGCELWDLSLVDPDNRRPVDYALRRRLLDEVRDADVSSIAETVADPSDPGTAKLWLVHRLLGARARYPELFDAGAGYQPLAADGPEAERVLAFSRGDGRLVVASVRYPGRGPVEPGTTVDIPGAARADIAEVVGRLPVAVLVDGRPVTG